MSEKDNLKSKTASLSTDAEKKTTAKTAVKNPQVPPAKR